MGTIITGIVFIIGGFISIICGNNMNNDFGSQFNSFCEYGQTDPGDTWIYVGVGLIVVGAILTIVGFINNRNVAIRDARETVNTFMTKYQRKMLHEYQAQLENGVITKAKYEELKADLLNDYSI